jgi:four helix bundle protein
MMIGFLDKAFDFSIRIFALASYLEEENKTFQLTSRLLESAVGICVCLRTSQNLPEESLRHCEQAYKLTLEAECLLELMVKTGAMNKVQSEAILADCRYLQSETKKLFKVAV